MGLKQKILDNLPDDIYLKMLYKHRIGKKLNLNNPQTFNEKLQWLKLHDHNPEYTTMVDKYEVKKYVSEKIGEQYIIPLLGVWKHFDDIDFDLLPNQFVLKCTHDSGGIVIIKDKCNFNREMSKKKIENSLKSNFYLRGREWPYKNVQPQIIAEQYIEDYETNELRDYKFFCFNGKVEFFKIDFNRFINHQANYYDINGEILPFGEQVCPPNLKKKLSMPYNLKQMIALAEELSREIPFIRVDFYEVQKKIFFGELTLYPASGFGKFIPDNFDMELGRKIVIIK